MPKLARRSIIKKHRHFQLFYSHGKSYANKYLALYVLPAGMVKGKAAFAAGRSLGPAVVRNRVRRLLRECYRLHQDELAPGCCLLLIGRRAIVKQKLAVVEKAFFHLIGKARLKRQREGGLWEGVY